MSRDLDELNYLADLEDDDNFEPSDYNTQDMRNINEKVNRILYGKNDEQPKNEKSEKKEPDQVDISKKATKPEHKEEKKPEYKEKKVEHKEKKENKKQEEKKETKPSDSNPTEELVDITKDPEMVDDVKEETKKPKNKKAIVGFIIGVAVVLCVVLVFVVQGVVSPSNNNAQQETTTSETKPTVAITNDKGEFVFAKGTKVSGVDIGGLTVVQARILLKSEEIKSRPKMNITVNVDGEETTYTEDDFTFKYDTSTVLDDEKIISKRMADGTTYPTTTDSNGNEYAKEQVMKISASLNQSSVDKLINKIYKKYNVKAKNARVTKFNPNSSPMFTYEEGKSGLEVDKDDLQSQINSIVEKGNASGTYTGTVTVTRTATQPKYDVAFLKKNMQLLASWETYSTNDANGNQNMKVSLKACNGSIIDPGETWSFNGCTGNSNDTSLGYASAGVIVDGDFTDGVGGGICQSSTTIYNAAVRSNLTIAERSPHTYPSVYAKSGFDAAIDYGNLDLKLKNDSKYQVFLACYMKGTTLHATFYGIKDDSYDVIDTYSENYDIQSSYYRARSYRIYRNKKGKEIRREELPSSYYSLKNGASVQTPDSGGTDYKHGGHVE